MFQFVVSILFLVLNLLPNADGCFARTQSIAIRGNLMCFGQPATGTHVRLYDFDFPDPDDLLDKGVVNHYGNFYLSGSTSEMMTIDPMLSIIHDCNDGPRPCQKRLDIKIPKNFVETRYQAERVYEMGTLHLEANFDGQSRDCIY